MQAEIAIGYRFANAESETPLPIKVFDIEVRRAIDPQGLDGLSDVEADVAGDDGYLRGNGRYEDHRGWRWEDVRATLDVEAAIVERLAGSDDSAAAEATFEAQRDLEGEGAEALWGLDVGIASAVIALSALGALPFISCNAGSFGGTHPASKPYVAFYLAAASPDLLLTLAEMTDAGLEVVDGVLCLYGRSVLDLLQFARLAEGWRP